MNYEALLYGSAVMTLASIALSGILIMRHVQKWDKPLQQRNILIIICMTPLFAIDSFIGLLELEAGEIVAHVLDLIKECYEAVVLNAFLMLMYDLCGLSKHVNSKEALQLPEGMKGRELHIPFPLNILLSEKHPHFDLKWLHRLRWWTIQFLILRPILSIIDFMLVDIFPNDYSKIIGIAIAVMLNISTTTAVYALLTFYHAFEEELAPYRPLAKLVCIKGVVFFATWQGVILKLLVYFDILHEGHRFSVDEIALAWQDLLVCIEMGLLFSPLCLYAYSPIDSRKDIDASKKVA